MSPHSENLASLFRSVSLSVARFSAFVCIMFLSGCGSPNQVNPALSTKMPKKILWAWERAEDLRFLNSKEFGVAFLAQTIHLEKDIVAPKPRRQPLEIAPGTYLIAVTRIETKKGAAERPDFSPEMTTKVTKLIRNTLDLPEVKAVQIDFDAVVSERGFYRSLINELKKQLPPETPLTMTSLASWCTGDAWFNDFPVDEAVPMVFQMGADSERIRNYLRNGNDWTEPLCRGSYGLSVNEDPEAPLKGGRRIYFFKNEKWKASDLNKS
jgi:hypothetical protein